MQAEDIAYFVHLLKIFATLALLWVGCGMVLTIIERAKEVKENKEIQWLRSYIKCLEEVAASANSNKKR